jgi:DNA-binding NarL/FixJ family response regulator
MYRKYMTTRNEYGIKRTDKSKTTEPFNEYDKEAEYEKVDSIIGAMSLNSRQRSILDFYMEGLGVSEISRRMNLATSTVWRNRMKLQLKFNEFMGV